MRDKRYLPTKNYTPDELIDILQDERLGYITIVVLFGSRARGDISARSDYDFGVVYRDIESSWGVMAEIYNDFLDILDLQEYQLDIVDIVNANREIKESIREDFIVLKGKRDELLNYLNINKT